MLRIKRLLSPLLVVCGLGLASAAQAASFECITNNSAASCGQGESTLSWAWDGANFTIYNASGGGYVSEVYFDTSAGMTVSFNQALSSSSVTFLASPVSPESLPGGSAVGFVSDENFDSDPVSKGAPVWGINAGEHGVFTFTGASLNSFDIDALVGGVHVRSLVNDKSEGFVTTVTAVPEPETYALMLAGLAAVGFMARRRRQS